MTGAVARLLAGQRAYEFRRSLEFQIPTLGGINRTENRIGPQRRGREKRLDFALELNDVCKRYGAHVAVDRLSLRAVTGQILGFLGPNGAGKTSTIRMIMSIIYPDSGEIRVLGKSRAVELKDRIGYLPEERGLYRRMSVEQTLRYFGKLKGMDNATLRTRIPERLEQVELLKWRRHRVEALSKGMSQKLQFLATILHDPDLVILDEPFSGLDPLNVETLKNLMIELRTRGKTVLFSTHQMELAEKLCDRLVLINRGRKLLEGALDDFQARLASRTLLIEGEGDFAALGRIPGAYLAEATATRARLELTDGVDVNSVLRIALGAARIQRVETHKPTLHEIFVQLVGADQAAAGGAAHG